MANLYQFRAPLTWTENEREERDVGNFPESWIVAERDMSGTVEVTINLAAVVKTLGRKACQNKSRKSVDGPIAVRCVQGPTLVQRRPVEPRRW